MDNQNFDENARIGGRVRNTMRIELNFWRSCLLNAMGLALAWLILPASEMAFTLPFIIFTMGVGMLFINALIIYWAARLIPGEGIRVGSYWAALLASFIVSVLSWTLAMVRSEKIMRNALRRKSDNSKDDDNVIDI